MIKGFYDKAVKPLLAAGALASMVAAPAFAGGGVQPADISKATDAKYDAFVQNIPQQYPTIFFSPSAADSEANGSIYNIGMKVARVFLEENPDLAEGKKAGIVIAKARPVSSNPLKACLSVAFKESYKAGKCTDTISEVSKGADHPEVVAEYSRVEREIAQDMALALNVDLPEQYASISDGETGRLIASAHTPF